MTSSAIIALDSMRKMLESEHEIDIMQILAHIVDTNIPTMTSCA